MAGITFEHRFGSNIDLIAPGAFLSMLLPLVVFFAFSASSSRACWLDRRADG